MFFLKMLWSKNLVSLMAHNIPACLGHLMNTLRLASIASLLLQSSVGLRALVIKTVIKKHLK